MEIQTEGIVVSAPKLWWLSIRTKSFKTGPLDGTVFPYVIKVRYTVDGKDYTKRAWINAGLPVPAVGSKLPLMYRSDKPSKARIL